MTAKYDAQKAVELQRKFCLFSGFPLFAPRDGVCYHCGNQIYEKISTAEAATRVVTSCPHCNHTFVD